MIQKRVMNYNGRKWRRIKNRKGEWIWMSYYPKKRAPAVSGDGA